ncbi:MAG: leucine-rich repeat protein, partial [Clostridia bacterium]|nr:leucine-rich repeat protein [Clostridia bacterium]
MKRLLSLLLAASMLVSLPVSSHAEDGAELLSEAAPAELPADLPDETAETEEPPEAPVRDVLTEEEVIAKRALYAENAELRERGADTAMLMSDSDTGSGTFGDGLTWSYENNTLTISGEGALPEYNNYSQYPWYTSFRSRIYNLVIGKDITYLPVRVLERLYNLSTITVEEGNLAYTAQDNVLFDKEMYMLVYYPGSLDAETYVIPSTVTEIGEGALADASQLTSLTIPASVLSIPEYALPTYGNLASVTVASGSKAFCSADGVLYDRNMTLLMFYPCQKTAAAFAIPDTVTQLRSSAFTENGYLTTITVPAAVVELGYHPFIGCTNLTAVTVHADNQVYASVDGVLCSKAMDTLLHYPAMKAGTSYTIPSTVETVENYALQGVQTLTELNVPASVSLIGDSAINACPALTAVNVDAANESYSSADGVLYDYHKSNLMLYPAAKTAAAYTVANTVETISSGAFYEVPALTTLTFPSSVSTIRSEAVFRCESLTDIHIEGSPILEDYAFSVNQVFTLHGLTGSRVDLYAQKYDITFVSTGIYTAAVIAQGNLTDTVSWTLDSLGTLTLTGSGVIEDPDGVLGEYEDAIRIVNIGDGITEISDRMFWYCRNLESVTVPASLTAMAENAVYPADSLVIHAPNGSIAELYASIQDIAFVCTDGENTEVVYASGTHGDNITWTLYDSAKLVLSGTGAMAEFDSYDSAPWYDLMRYVKNLVIEDGITTLAEYFASDMYHLATVTIPASVTVIPEDAIYLYNNTVVFYGDDGSEAEIFVKAHGYSFFVTEGEDTLNIYAQDTYDNITWVLYDNAELALTGDGDIGALTSYNRTYPWYENGLLRYRIRTATLGEGITGIGNYCFDNLRLLTNVSLPSTLTAIGTYGFYRCESLVTVTLPAAVTSIGERAFSYCYDLIGIYLEAGNTAFTSDSGILFNADMTELIVYPAGRPNTAYVIPEGITTIGSGVFSSSGIRTLTIPASASVIDSYTDFSGMERLIVSEDNTLFSSDDYGVLYNKDKTVLYIYPGSAEYTEFTVPSTVTCIDEGAFRSAHNLKTIVVPASAEEFGYNAFSAYQGYTVHCYDGTAAEVYVKSNSIPYFIIDGDTVNTLDSGTTGNLTWTLTDDGRLSITGTGTMPGYSSSGSPWYEYRTAIQTVELGEGVTSIGACAFYQCSNLTGVTLPSTLTSIGNQAFRYCNSLEAFEIPASVTSIGTNVFQNCYNMTLTLNSANTAFVMDGCTLLSADRTVLYFYFGAEGEVTEYTIPASVTEIKPYAFHTCEDAFEKLNIPESVTSVGEYAFTALYNLTDIYIYAREAAFASNALNNYSGLTIHVYDGTPAEFYAKSLSNVTVDVMDGDKPNNIAEGDCGESVTWALNDAGVLTISGTGAMTDYTSDTNVPWISYSRSTIRSIVIEDGVTSVGDYAFYDARVAASVTIADSVTSIGDYAFCYAYELAEVTLPANLTTLGEFAFAYCDALTELTLPDSLTTIGYSAFDGCRKLTSIEIPANVTSIGINAFRMCNSLTTMTVADGNTAFCAENNVLYSADKTVLYIYLCTKTDSAYSIPETVVTIKSHAVYDNDSLTSLVIPASVKTIEETAIISNWSLTDVTIYSTDAVFGENSVSGSANGFTITAHDGSTAEFYAKEYGYTFNPIGGVDNPNAIVSGGCGESVTWTLWDDGRLVISGTGDMTDYTDTSETPWYSSYRNKIKSIVVEDGVTRIGNYALANLDYCTSVSLADSITTIGYRGLYDNDGLTEIVLPDGLVSLEDYALYYGTSLKSITIGSKLESFAQYSFGNLSSLETITVDASNPNLYSENGILYGGTVLYLVPRKHSMTEYTIPDGITTIAERAVYQCSNLVSLTIPSSVTKINSYAVRSCYNLSSVIIHAEETEIMNYAIYDNASGFVITAHDGSDAEFYAKDHGITFQVFEGEEDLPNDVATGKLGTEITWALSDTGVLTISGTGTIPDYSGYSSNPWYYDYRLDVKSVVIGEGITAIGQYTFGYLSAISSITLPSTLETISDYAFYECGALTSIDIPASVTSIGTYVFYECDSLTAININEGNTAYASVDGVLYDKDIAKLIAYPKAKKDTAYTAPETVTTVGKYAFYYTKYLQSITLPDALETVENNAVYYGDMLTDIIVHSTDAVYSGSLSINCSTSKITVTAHNASTTEYYAKEKGYTFKVFDGETDTADVMYEGFCNTDETVKWELYDDGLLRISGTGAMDDYSSSSSVPWYSYRSSKVKSIEVADGVTHIGKYAFADCYSSESVSIADSVTSIGDYAFRENNKLASLTLSANLTTIGNYSFTSCYKLTSITIPASVTFIGTNAFNGISMLTEIIVEDGNTAYCSEYGVLFNADKTTLILYPRAKTDTEYVVPSTVTTLSGSAFSDVSKLTSLTLPASLKTVGVQAIRYGDYLKNITIYSMDAEFVTNSFYLSSPSTVTITVHDGSTAEIYAKELGCIVQYFDGETDTANTVAEGTCGDNLTWILDDNGLLVISGEGAMTNFTSASGAPWYEYKSKVQSIAVEEGITSIGDYAFYYYETNLTSVTLADSITAIGNYAFYYCDEVTEFNIPANLVSIGTGAFNRMYVFTELDLPDTLTTIGSSAFSNCNNITYVRIPASAATIADNAFRYCTALESIVVDADNTAYSSEDGVFYDKGKTILYTYPADSALTSYEIPDTVTEIKSYAFYYTSLLESVTIPESVTTLGQYNFTYCDSLTSATVYAREATPGYYSFRYNASGFTVNGYTGSAIETYCSDCSITFSALAEDEDEENLTATFTVVDSTSDDTAPLNGAMVYVFNEDGSVDRKRTTGTSGVITMELEDGFYTVQVYKNGYELRTLTVEITGENRAFTIGLSTESILQVSTTVTEITREEAIQAGVDVSADENRQIYECTAVLQFMPTGYTYYCAGNEVISGEPVHYNGITVQPVAKDVFLIVYSEVAWLKEMFKVELVASNTSTFETIEDCEAVIDLPDGVSLAVMTDEVGQQSTNADLGSIAPKSSSNHIWYLVGDEKGEYYINGIVNGTRVGGGISEDIAVGFTTKTPITVLAGDAMHLTITAEKYATAGETYRMLYRLDNVSSKTLYDVSLNVLGGKFVEEYNLTESDFEYIPEVEGGPELSGTFAHGYTISDTEFTPGEYLSGMFEITFGTGIELDAIEYMLKSFFTVTGKGSTTEIPTTIELVDSLDPCVFEITETKEPTCTEDGERTLTCSHCTIVKTETIPALGHDFEPIRTVDKAATCTEEGSASFHCTRCDATTGSITLSPLGHDYVWTYDTEPDCENGGHGTGVCSRCDDTITEDVPALGHNWSEWEITQEPTCTEKGSREKNCDRCDGSVIETIDALGHDWPEWTYDPAPTCEEAGHRTRTCARCTLTETDDLPALGHNWTEWVESPAAACEVEGKKIRTCLRCGTTEEEILPALEHQWSDPVVIEPTCTEDGTSTTTCSLCGKEEVTVTPMLGHDWDDGVCTKYPTLTEEGIMLFTCQRCGETREDIIPFAEEPDAGFYEGLFPNNVKKLTYVYGAVYSFYYTPYYRPYDDGDIDDEPGYIFSSSDEEVATVEKDGEVIIRGVGETQISVHYEKYVSYDSKTGEYTSYVEKIDSYTLIVTPASLTVTVADAELFYGDDPAELAFSCTYDGFVSFPAHDYYEDESVLDGTMTYACDYAQYDNAGEYAITGSGLTARNYTITFEPGTLTVNKAKDYTIALGNLTQTRGQSSDVVTDIAPQDSTAVITVEYKVDDAWTTAMPTDAGDYAVRASLTSSSNIEVTDGRYFTDTLTIEPTELTILMDDMSVCYGE